MNGRIIFGINSSIIVLVAMTFSSSPAATFQVSNSSQLQSALLNALNNGQNDTIRLAQGVYTGNFIYSGHVAGDLIIEGGWRNDFTGRVINADNTVLDGNQQGSVFIYSCDRPGNLMLDGITFQNGKHSNDGVGIYIHHLYDNWNQVQNKTTITNSTIKNNSATEDNDGVRGIGLYIWTYTEIAITNNIFTGNHPLEQNYASFAGGAMYLETNNKLDIITNHIYNNKANTGGGIYLDVNSQQVRIIGNTINDNEATQPDHISGSGGGINASNWVLETPSIISQNIISHNKSGQYGGGIIWSSGGGDVIFTNNLITGNTATLSGGGVTIWARSDYVRTIDFTNNTVASNQAGRHGGGLDLWMLYDGATANVYNNIFWGNVSDDPGYDMYLDNDYDDNYLASVCNLYNNNFNQSDWGIFMDIPFSIHSSNLNHKDPLFADPLEGNYKLAYGSPSLNTGNNNAPSLPSTDLLGNLRIQNGIVDMGAYEGAGTLVSVKPVLSHLILLLKE
ncbi:MAG: hypothetical protein KJ804_20510 [Proteobacteria bacterium]|nr:hypothetical protein [Pseudomonadota bacterium]